MPAASMHPSLVDILMILMLLSPISPADRYLSKISGPLLDRIDIHIEVTPFPLDKLSEERKGEKSIDIRKRVTKARELQTQRFQEYDNIHYNA